MGLENIARRRLIIMDLGAGLVIDSTTATSPATFCAISAMTVKVVTALSFSAAGAAAGMMEQTAIAAAAATIMRLVD